MHFYEPGPYEELIGRLASMRVNPHIGVWNSISKKLDAKERHKKRLRIRPIAVAASIAIAFSSGLLAIQIQYLKLFNTDLAQWQTKRVIISTPNQDQKLRNTINSETSISPIKLAQVPIVQNNDEDELESNKIKKHSYSYINSISPKLKTNNKTLSAPTYISPKQINPHNQTILEINKKTSINPWSLAFFINPTFSYHTTAAINYRLNPNETWAWLMGAEILARRKINNYFSVYSGLILNPIGQNINNLVLVQSSTMAKELERLEAYTSYGVVNLDNPNVGISNFSLLSNTSGSVIKSSSLNSARLKQRFYYLEVPLILSTNFSKGNIDVEIKLGCAAGFLIDNKFEINSPIGTFSGKTERIRNKNASILGGVSISVPINNQLNMLIEPNARLNFLPVSYSYIATYPFNASVKLGLEYNF